jgi:large subunit ribosomal protein L9
VPITVNVARSAEEAERQARGEDLTVREAFEPAAETEDQETEGVPIVDAEGGGVEAGAER